MNIKNLIQRPWLLLPPKWTYFLGPFALKIYRRASFAKPCQWKSVQWRHLSFPNPLGTAGGIDKNGICIKDYWALGAGFLEIGTVSPKPQQANPSKILDRSLEHLSLWNNMGFPNRGMEFVRNQLSRLPQKKASPIFINIGKNRETPLPQALEDYKKTMALLHPFADLFVLNISSPNTKGLRGLFAAEILPHFLNSLRKFLLGLDPKIPMILKLSPDEREILRIIQQSVEAGIDGWCISNSTKERPIPKLFPERGGVSGKLLAAKSLALLKEVKKYLLEKGIQDKLLISCGGVLTAQDVLHRLQEGADLVQVYSALVFEGPGFFRSVCKKLSS